MAVTPLRDPAGRGHLKGSQRSDPRSYMPGVPSACGRRRQSLMRSGQGQSEVVTVSDRVIARWGVWINRFRDRAMRGGASMVEENDSVKEGHARNLRLD